MKTFRGNPSDASKARFAVVASHFNPKVTDALVEGAVHTLKASGVNDDRISVVRVPGAFEVPLACQWVIADVDAVIALSCIIRGGTPHFDFVATEVSSGCTRVALDSGKPVAFGVLTCDDLDQALSRASGLAVPAQSKAGGGDESDAPLHGNKGSEAAAAALEMVALKQQVKHG